MMGFPFTQVRIPMKRRSKVSAGFAIYKRSNHFEYVSPEGSQLIRLFVSFLMHIAWFCVNGKRICITFDTNLKGYSLLLTGPEKLQINHVLIIAQPCLCIKILTGTF